MITGFKSKLLGGVMLMDEFGTGSGVAVTTADAEPLGAFRNAWHKKEFICASPLQNSAHFPHDQDMRAP